MTTRIAARSGHVALRRAPQGDTGSVPEWEPNLEIEPPPWMVDGARVVHGIFGSGTIGRVGAYKDVPTVWIDFDDGQTKALALEFGLPHLAPGPATKPA